MVTACQLSSGRVRACVEADVFLEPVIRISSRMVSMAASTAVYHLMPKQHEDLRAVDLVLFGGVEGMGDDGLSFR